MTSHAKSLQSCLTLCNPMDCSPPGSSVHEILQARILEWLVIFFSQQDLPNPGIELDCRQILYSLSHQGSPILISYDMKIFAN